MAAKKKQVKAWGIACDGDLWPERRNGAPDIFATRAHAKRHADWLSYLADDSRIRVVRVTITIDPPARAKGDVG